MAVKNLTALFDAAGKRMTFYSGDVYDKVRKMTLETFMSLAPTTAEAQALIDAAVQSLQNNDIKAVADNLSALETTVNTFLTGDDDNNGTIDRLKELVAAIAANKDSIDALLEDKVDVADIVDSLESEATDAPLSANQGKVLKGLIDDLDADSHTHDNKSILDGISTDDNSGNLVYNGKELNGETGVAYGTSLETATTYSGKIRVVMEEYTEPAEEEAA